MWPHERTGKYFRLLLPLNLCPEDVQCHGVSYLWKTSLTESFWGSKGGGRISTFCFFCFCMWVFQSCMPNLQLNPLLTGFNTSNTQTQPLIKFINSSLAIQGERWYIYFLIYFFKYTVVKAWTLAKAAWIWDHPYHQTGNQQTSKLFHTTGELFSVKALLETMASSWSWGCLFVYAF